MNCMVSISVVNINKAALKLSSGVQLIISLICNERCGFVASTVVVGIFWNIESCKSTSGFCKGVIVTLWEVMDLGFE